MVGGCERVLLRKVGVMASESALFLFFTDLNGLGVPPGLRTLINTNPVLVGEVVDLEFNRSNVSDILVFLIDRYRGMRATNRQFFWGQ